MSQDKTVNVYLNLHFLSNGNLEADIRYNVPAGDHKSHDRVPGKVAIKGAICEVIDRIDASMIPQQVLNRLEA